MYEVLIDDVWDGRIHEEVCETEEEVENWVKAYSADDTYIRIYKNGMLVREV